MRIDDPFAEATICDFNRENEFEAKCFDDKNYIGDYREDCLDSFKNNGYYQI